MIVNGLKIGPGANLTGADLFGANLEGADLRAANLKAANLRAADLARANLTGADLRGAHLTDAHLTGAHLTDAHLTGATLTGANLTGATMPDGRPWEAYRADHLAGLCQTPEVRAKALEAWGKHTWQDCPMHTALGLDGPSSDLNVGAWVALYDAQLLERPGS